MEICKHQGTECCRGSLGTRGAEVEPQKTQGTEMSFDPHCGPQAGQVQGQTKLWTGTEQGWEREDREQKLQKDTASITAAVQPVRNYLSFRKASQRAAIPCRLVLHYFPVTALLPTRSTQVPPAKPQEHSRELREKVLPPGPGANIHLYTEVVCTPG